MGCGEFMSLYSIITVGRSLARKPILRTSRGEWFRPFAFFIAYFVKKWIKYLSTQKSGKKNLGTVSW